MDKEKSKQTRKGMQGYIDSRCRYLELFVRDHGGKEILQHLTDKERYILQERIKGKKTQKEIANEMGISQQMVNLYISIAKKKIKKANKINYYIY